MIQAAEEAAVLIVDAMALPEGQHDVEQLVAVLFAECRQH
jgi:hypothetical protein